MPGGAQSPWDCHFIAPTLYCLKGSQKASVTTSVETTHQESAQHGYGPEVALSSCPGYHLHGALGPGDVVVWG